MSDFKSIQAALVAASIVLHPSEVHGLISGVLCTDTAKSCSWEASIMGRSQKKEIKKVLKTLYDSTHHALSDLAFEFQPLLPDESEDLSVRAEGLTLWCQGFLTGLKLAGYNKAFCQQEDVIEAINDITEIAKMHYDEVVANEEDEAAYVELVEFVRVAVILMFEDRLGKRSLQ
jgi:yecA family protein